MEAEVATGKIQFKLLPESMELVWAMAVPNEASESLTSTKVTSWLPLTVSFHWVPSDSIPEASQERRVRVLPDAPLRVRVPPARPVWVLVV